MTSRVFQAPALACTLALLALPATALAETTSDTPSTAKKSGATNRTRA